MQNKTYIVRQDQLRGSNTNKFWTNVKALIPNSNSEEQITLQDGLEKNLPMLEAANKLNEHFTMVGPSL